MKNIQHPLCPMCGEPTFAPHEDGVHKFNYNRRMHIVSGIHYAQCSDCGTKGYLPGQIAANKARIEEYQKSIVSYISPSQIRSLREKYLLSQSQASKIFGGGKMAFSKWERGIVIPAEPTAKLMLLALESSDAMQRLADMAGEKIDIPVEPTYLVEVKSVDISNSTSDDSLQLWKEWVMGSFEHLMPSARSIIWNQSAEYEAEFDSDNESLDEKSLWQKTEKKHYHALN